MQPTSPQLRLMCHRWSRRLQREDYPELQPVSHQTQMAPGMAGCPKPELVRKIRKMPAQRCRYTPPSHWQSIQMEAFLQTPPRDQLANVLIPVPPPWLHLMYEWTGAGEDDVVEERRAISVCPLKLVLWLFSIRSPPRDPRRGWGREPSSGKRPRSPKLVTLRLPSAQTVERDISNKHKTRHGHIKNVFSLLFLRMTFTYNGWVVVLEQERWSKYHLELSPQAVPVYWTLIWGRQIWLTHFNSNNNEISPNLSMALTTLTKSSGSLQWLIHFWCDAKVNLTCHMKHFTNRFDLFHIFIWEKVHKNIK